LFVQAGDKIPNIAGIKFPTYNRTIVSMREARFLITRGEFFMIKEMYERGMSFRYREGIGDRSENRPKIYSLPQSPFQIQAKTKKKQVGSI